MERTRIRRRVLPERKRVRTLTRTLKRIVDDARVEPEAYLRFWRAGRGGE